MTMIKNYIRFLILVLFISCNNDYIPRNLNSITISSFDIDSVSIRAINTVNDKEMSFVTSNGDIGFVTHGKDIELHKIKYDSIVPNFRSIAFNGSDFFALSIGSPALLFKYDRKTSKLVYQENHERVFYDSMAFFDSKNGIAMGDPTDDCLSVIKTINGGKSWAKISCHHLPKVVEGEAAFAASNTNIKVLGNTVWMVSGGSKARVFKSSDLGHTWEVFETPIIQGKNSQGIYSVDFADENNGIIIGGDYSKPNENIANKAITTDGGATWTLVANGKNPSYKSCVQYVPNTNGKEIFAVGKTGVSYSNDGGIIWKEVSQEQFYTIQFVNRNMAWLGGNHKVGKLILN